MKVLSQMIIPTPGKLVNITKTYDTLDEAQRSFVTCVQDVGGLMLPPTENGAHAHLIREADGPNITNPEWGFAFDHMGKVFRNWLRG